MRRKAQAMTSPSDAPGDGAGPVRIRFGPGALDQIGAAIAGRPYVILTYDDPLFETLAGRVARRAGPPLAVVGGVRANPDLETLETLRARMAGLDGRVAVLVALGGGSVIDAAKVLAAAMGRRTDVEAVMAAGSPGPHDALPIIAAPTTAGTGSEVTCWATVWDRRGRRKLSLERPDLYPQAAVIDPELMVGLPADQTLASGLDALSHALESLWNRNADALSRRRAVSAARTIMNALPRVLRRPGDLEARTAMAHGALEAGLAFSRTRTALAHNISYPLTLERAMPHGLACSFCLPQVMQAALGASADCDAAIAAIFDRPPAEAPATLRGFLAELGVSADPSAHGVEPHEWRRIVADAFDGARGRNFIGRRERFPFVEQAA